MSDQSVVSPDDLSDEILRDRAHGQSIRAIAQARRLTIAEVERLLNEAVDRALSGAELRREIAEEKVRLADLKQVFFTQGRTGDVASGAVYAKLSERLSSMMGMNAPQSHAVQLSMQAAPREENSLENLERILAEARARREAKRANGGGEPSGD